MLMNPTYDLMFHGHRLRAFFRRTFSQPPPTSQCYLLLLQLKPFFSYPLSISHSFFSTPCDSSDKLSFTISYLTNTCGFSPQAAIKASKRVRFSTANKPDSVIDFFTNHGFSISQIHSIIRREPGLIVCNPTERVLPKFQFLASKGASASDIVTTVTRNPRFLRYSLQNHIIPNQKSHKILSTTSDSDKQSFTVSYFKNNCGFSHQAALKASNRVLFNDAKKPDSVITFFTNHGFTLSQTHNVIGRTPELLLFDPTTKILPKFQFLASKGASPSDIVTTVTRASYFLLKSLENHIIPAFEFVRRFCPSDEKALACALFGSTSYTIALMKSKVQLLLDMGVPPPNIYLLLRTWPSVLRCADLKEAMEEVKGLGFHPSKTPFISALRAKRCISKSLWDAKLDAFKTWGWSEDAVLDAFRKEPRIMLFSIKKVNAVMSFWVGHLGWDPAVLQAAPSLFGYSLEKRLMPRASVVQHLLSRGLMKYASLTTPFIYTDKLFLQKFVQCFEEEEKSKLQSLYRGGC